MMYRRNTRTDGDEANDRPTDHAERRPYSGNRCAARKPDDVFEIADKPCARNAPERYRHSRGNVSFTRECVCFYFIVIIIIIIISLRR